MQGAEEYCPDGGSGTKFYGTRTVGLRHFGPLQRPTAYLLLLWPSQFAGGIIDSFCLMGMVIGAMAVFGCSL